MWQGLTGLRENLGKGLQEFKKEALRESSTLIREVSKVGPALIKENALGDSSEQENEKEEVAHSSSIQNKAENADGEALGPDSEGWDNGWDEGEHSEEVPPERTTHNPQSEDTHKVANEFAENHAGVNGVAEEGSFVELDIHASHTGALQDNEDGDDGQHSLADASSSRSASTTPKAFGMSDERRDTEPQEDPELAGDSPMAAAITSKQLGEVTGQRDRLAERLDVMEDELEAAKAHQASLEAALQAARKEAAVAVEERNAAEAKATRQEMEAAAARKKQEALEGKVKALAGGLEQRMQGLRQELETRTSELVASRAEVAEARSAFDEVKAMLEESSSERERLGEELAQLKGQWQQAKDEAAKYKHEAEGARREIAESVAELSEVRADLWATKEAAKGNALGEDERASLEAALKAVSASAQTAAAEAGAWKVRAETAEEQVTTLQASLGAAEAAVAAGEQRVLEAEMAAQEAARAANQAQLSSAELKEQSEQRSRIFRAAVKAAVGKIQTELEHERDAALERAQHLERDLKDHAARLQETQASLEAVSTELASEQRSAEEARAAAASREERLETVLRKLSEAEDETRAQRRQAEAAREVATQLTHKLSSAEAEYAENRTTAQMASQQRDWAEERLAAETARLSKLLEEIERERDNVKAAAAEASSRSAEEVASSRARVAELEGKLAVLESRSVRGSEEARLRAERNRSPAATSAGRGGDSGLEDLGLEGVRWKATDDWEAPGEARSRKPGKRGAVKAPVDDSWWGREEHEAGSRGRISKRTAVVLLYLFILHIMVMISFTNRASPLCIDMGAQIDNQLPG
ncbi:hypothetical protein KFL_002890100 [Klebsormidium nitens]|uniref:Uncharacterized protein n=1 Tax=Klebsormidium nitens TaxID=105231 RepID=A0A1Y1I7E1_KLENI|nr:hypothetical protein KFL_002890100 [Klebsormidium nitens]|eukprot:GAQ86443.1 hypothetical protein KFL_002890100 [Klebsormidium nitens]